MIDERTPNLELPLPSERNTLADDVWRLRSALIAVDSAIAGKEPADSALLKEEDIGSTVQAYDATILKSSAIGSTVQAYDPDLSAVAGLSSNGLIERTGNGTATAVPITAAGKALLDDADAAAQRTTLGLVIGTHVQAYDADTAKRDVAQTWTAKQKFGPTAETWTALSGTTPAITAGSFTWSLTANSTPTDGLAAGDHCTLMIADGSARTINWANLVDVWLGGAAPILHTTNYTVVMLWKVGTTVYGSYLEWLV